MTATVSILFCLLSAPLADPAEAVAAGREALGEGWQYPWYDADHDSLRRLDVREETPPPDLDRPASLFGVGQMLQLLGWVGIAVILGLLTWLVIAAWRAHAYGDLQDTDADGIRADPDRVDAIPIPGIADAAGLLDEARRLYQQGDYSRAVLYLFAHELCELDRMQVIRLARGKTNRQYLREIGRRPALRQLVEQTMIAFEEVFFGSRHLDRPRFEACWSRVPEFDALVQGGAA